MVFGLESLDDKFEFLRERHYIEAVPKQDGHWFLEAKNFIWIKKILQKFLSQKQEFHFKSL